MNDTAAIASPGNLSLPAALRLRETSIISSRNRFSNAVSGNSSFVQRLELQRKLVDHAGCVNTVAFTPCGTKLISGSDDLQIKLWDWQKQDALCASWESGHWSNVFQARVIPPSDGNIIVTTGADGQVRVSSISECGGAVHTANVGTQVGRIHKLAFGEHPWSVYTCGEDGSVLHIDLRQPRRPSKLLMRVIKSTYRPLELYSIAFNPLKPSEFCVGGQDEAVRIFDLRHTGKSAALCAVPLQFLAPRCLASAVQRRRGYEIHCTCAVYSKRGEILASYNDEDIYLLDPYSVDRAATGRDNKEVFLNEEKEEAVEGRPQRRGSKQQSNVGFQEESCTAARKRTTRSSVQRAQQQEATKSKCIRSTIAWQTGRAKRDSKRKKVADLDDAVDVRKFTVLGNAVSDAAMKLMKSKVNLMHARGVGTFSADIPEDCFLTRFLQGGGSESESSSSDDDGENDDDDENSILDEQSVHSSANDVDDDDDEGDEGDTSDSIGMPSTTSSPSCSLSPSDDDVDDENEQEESSTTESDEDDDDDDSSIDENERWPIPHLSHSLYGDPQIESGINVDSGVVQQVFRGHRNQQTIKGVSFFGSDDEWVMSGSDDGYIMIWSVATGEVVAMLRGDSHVVNCVERHPFDVFTLATSGIEADVKIWGATAAAEAVGGLSAKDLTRLKRNYLRRRVYAALMGQSDLDSGGDGIISESRAFRDYLALDSEEEEEEDGDDFII